MHISSVAEQFTFGEKVVRVREIGSGNINDTFLVTLDSAKENHFILQRINSRVFKSPELVMENMRIVADHVRKSLHQMHLEPGRRWEVVRVLKADDGKDHWRGPDGSFWRALNFVRAASAYDTVRDKVHAREAGYALGLFHALLADLPVEQLADTLEGFHVTPRYLRHYDTVLAQNRYPESSEVKYCLEFVRNRREWAHVLENARASGTLTLRPIHGDPKVNNIMVDDETGKAVGMIDLDTVGPGLVLYDIGDCLRSACNTGGEEKAPGETVSFDPDICRAVLAGYSEMGGDFLTENDYEYMFDAIRLIAFELGLRYFTDYLEGDTYFKASFPGQNLARACVQFGLTESIEKQERVIRAIIDGMK